MLSVLIALVAGSAFGGALFYTTSLHPAVSAITALAAFTLIYVLILKQVMKRVGDAMEVVQKDIMSNRPEAAVHKLEAVKKQYAYWQFFIDKQMNSQIGMVYYLRRDFSKAYDYLDKSFVRHLVVMAMLAILPMKRNQPSKMIVHFDRTVAWSLK